MLRAVVIYVYGVALVRLAHRRFMGRHTPFDLILAIVLGAVLARAINGNGPFVATLAAGLLLVLLDRLFAVAAYHSVAFRRLVEGRPRELVRGGEVRLDALRKSHVTLEDLRSAIRRAGLSGDPGRVEEAYIERGGEVSVVPRRDEGG